MFYWHLILLALVSLHLRAQEKPLAVSEQQVLDWIVTADSYRLPFKSGEFATSLTLYKNEKRVETSDFFVQLNAAGDSRVTMLDKRSRGQKVLLTESAMWLYIPRSKKAIRITPMQRLMGQASYGDVSSLNWQHEYQWDKSAVIERQINTLTSVCFTLQAKRKSATYRAVYLCLDKDSLRPIKAQFYLASGKLMKQAHYTYSPDSRLIAQTRFMQPGKDSQYTLMENSNLSKKQHNSNLFTRQGFIRK